MNARAGAKYPAVLLTTGLNDPRVSPWLPGKMAAERIEPHAGGRGWSRMRLVLKSLIVVGGVGGSLFAGWQNRHSYHGDARIKPPLYGIWEVTEYTLNQQSVPPLLLE